MTTPFQAIRHCHHVGGVNTHCVSTVHPGPEPPLPQVPFALTAHPGRPATPSNEKLPRAAHSAKIKGNEKYKHGQKGPDKLFGNTPEAGE